ncbi:MAG: lipid-A-disaccharide synthase [Rhabdochlamydiaceae bacterium]
MMARNGLRKNWGQSMSCDLFVFAGEQSGDLHGEKLIQALHAKNPHLKISGVGGPKMRSQGIDCILPMEEFQVMGFIDVFLALPKLIRQFYFVAGEIKRLKPKAVIAIDYPGFNLRMAKHLRKKGFEGKLIHFICPSVWAWGKKRIPMMGTTLDLLLSIFPFEKKLFKSTPLQVAYVGHPLIERLKNYPYKTPPFSSEKKMIALFPGSRRKEIERNLPLYLDVCRDLLKKEPKFQIALSVSEESYRPLIVEILKGKQWQEREILFIPAEYSYELMKTAYMAIAKSGTVTLELALHRVPTVVTYGVSFLDTIITYYILKIRLRFYCIVNIIAQKEIFSELIGPNFTLSTLKEQAESLLLQSSRSKIQYDCDLLAQQLGDKGTATEAAIEILQRI